MALTMAKMIGDLRREHNETRELLAVLEQELSVFHRQEHPDYEVIQDVLDYLRDYPTLCHHPAEQAVFDRLAARAPVLAQAVGDLGAEHRQEAAVLRAASEAVGNVLMDLELPRDEVEDAVKRLVAYKRAHMEMEERLLFPAADEALQPEDWAAIETSLRSGEAARKAAAERCRQTRERLLRWERENLAERG